MILIFIQIRVPKNYIVVDDKLFVSIDKDTELME